MGWTLTKRDASGRVTEVETFAGSALPTPWGGNTDSTGKVTTVYSGNQVTVTDQAGKVKRSSTDGLGRMKDMVEDPSGLNYLTSYTYDVLDNLAEVTQGSQTRSFVYNPLSRLTDATNPESGHTGYTYDANGNLLMKTDGPGVVTTFDAYDGLNRPTRQSYNDTPRTPEVVWC